MLVPGDGSVIFAVRASLAFFFFFSFFFLIFLAKLKDYSMESTSSQANHLRKEHNVCEEGSIDKKLKEDRQRLITDVLVSSGNVRLTFEPTILHLLLLTWLVVHNLPHLILTSTEFLNIVMYLAACVSLIFILICFLFRGQSANIYGS